MHKSKPQPIKCKLIYARDMYELGWLWIPNIFLICDSVDASSALLCIYWVRDNNSGKPATEIPDDQNISSVTTELFFFFLPSIYTLSQMD